MKIIFFACMLMTQWVTAQVVPYPRDTSFTLQGTYEKELKKRPYISIAPKLISNNIIAEENIVYRAFGERKLLLDIYHPLKYKKNRPVVLLVYGGGWKSGDKSQNEAIARMLVIHGYVAVSAEYRLSPEALYPAALYDLKAVIRWVKARAKLYGINPNAITVMGFSAGGQLAALMGTTNNNPAFEDRLGDSTYSSAIHAVINVDGILAFKHPESEEGASASLWFGGNYTEKPELWNQASALSHVDAHTVPFCFINSSLPRFHAGRDDMIAKMTELGIYQEVHTIEDTPHPFWFFNPWFQPMMKIVYDFLDKHAKK